jgi:hypothetical protein
MELHYRLRIKHLGEHLAALNMRKHLAFNTKGMPGASELRDRINHARTTGQVWNIISGPRYWNNMVGQYQELSFNQLIKEATLDILFVRNKA